MVRLRHDRMLRQLKMGAQRRSATDPHDRKKRKLSPLMISIVYPQAFAAIMLILIGALSKRAAAAEGLLLLVASLMAPTRQAMYSKLTAGLTFLFCLHLMMYALGRVRWQPYSRELAIARFLAVVASGRALWMMRNGARATLQR